MWVFNILSLLGLCLPLRVLLLLLLLEADKGNLTLKKSQKTEKECVKREKKLAKNQ